MEGTEIMVIDDDASEFTLAEDKLSIEPELYSGEARISSMPVSPSDHKNGELLQGNGRKDLSPEFYQEVATKFSCSKRRKGKSSIPCEQVQSWFEDKQKKSLAKITMLSVQEEFHRPSEFSSIDYTQESRHKSKAERIAGLSELIFEAKSGRDDGWYDVAAFFNYRITYRGELEVRVRFAGFHYGHDEWVDVKRKVRERSIPLEPCECGRVIVGDRTLCFRENDNLAIYCDAEIVEIKRRLHDDSCCSCSFAVRYYYDLVEEQVGLNRICCRPA